MLEGKVQVGKISKVSSSLSVQSLRMGIMRENFFDVLFWNTDAKQRVLMELARTHIRIQRWIMQKPCGKLGWIKFSDAGCTCGLLMKDVAVQVAMTV